MMEIELFASEIDSFTERMSPENILVSFDTYIKLREVYEIFSYVEPGEDDEYRHTWIEVKRGTISAFGDYEEFKDSGEVESRKEFEQLWKEYYPKKTKWYKFETAKYENELFFYFNSKLISSIKEDNIPEKSTDTGHGYFDRFFDWLLKRIISETNKLKQDAEAYNNNIQQNLSYTKRIGKIRRGNFWDILGKEAYRLSVILGKDNIEKIGAIVGEIKNEPNPVLNRMTANEFFRICEICYDANNYFGKQDKEFTPKEKYLKMADGRDAGLQNIDGGSPEAFYKWFHSGGTLGAHPWEICRGGNSTHISLFVSEKNGNWFVRLAGSSIARVEETVRMAIALTENKISFELTDAEEIYRMVTGNDYIGIVPDTVSPRYCHGLFPKEDRIIDFMNLNFDEEINTKVIEKSYWYPLEFIQVI